MHFGKIVSGQSILSKYELKDYERIVLERVADNPLQRRFVFRQVGTSGKVKVEGKEVVVINLHLEAFDKATRVRQFEYVLNLLISIRVNTLQFYQEILTQKLEIVKPLFKNVYNGWSRNAAFSTENPENTFDTKIQKNVLIIFLHQGFYRVCRGSVLKSSDRHQIICLLK